MTIKEKSMATITEDYVSFKTAKLLKEKGFDENCNALYDSRNVEFCEKQTGYVFNNSQWENFITAPTLQMVMKWIRKQGFYIIVDIDVNYDEDERGSKWYYKPAWDWVVFRIYDREQMSDDGALYATYEQSAEVAIKWCLENLI